MDKDGYLDYAEFVAISVHLRKMGSDDHLSEAFKFFDKNETGFIEIEELRDALTDEAEAEAEATSEEVINAIIQDVDTDKVSIPHFPSPHQLLSSCDQDQRLDSSGWTHKL